MSPTLLSREQKATLAATPQTTQWNVLLHGLFIIQLAPGGDSSKIRIVLPYVNNAEHTHVYEAGHSAPWSNLAHGENKLLFNYSAKTPAAVTIYDTDKIVIPSTSLYPYSPLNNLSPGSIPASVFCWIDAPMPDEIVPLRSKPKPPAGDKCGWDFGGTVGSQIRANQLPFLLALIYKEVASSVQLPNFPGSPSPEAGNLFLFSEPPHRTTMDSETPFIQMRNVLGLSESELSFTGPFNAGACPAAQPDPVPPVSGVNHDDEEDLAERDPEGSFQSETIHVRSCMALIVV